MKVIHFSSLEVHILHNRLPYKYIFISRIFIHPVKCDALSYSCMSALFAKLIDKVYFVSLVLWYFLDMVQCLRLGRYVSAPLYAINSDQIYTCDHKWKPTISLYISTYGCHSSNIANIFVLFLKDAFLFGKRYVFFSTWKWRNWILLRWNCIWCI